MQGFATMRDTVVTASGSHSAAARARFALHEGRPQFFADWLDVTMLHYAVPPEALAPHVPFPLDLHDGRAYVSLVVFTQQRLRPALHGPWGRVAEFLSAPLAHHRFLNVRTYVRRNDEPGIYFLAEWLTSRLAVMIGPALYGLPYRFSRVNSRVDGAQVAAEVFLPGDGDTPAFAFEAHLRGDAFSTAEDGSLDAFLLERYTAYTRAQHAPYKGVERRFRIWHAPWPQHALDLTRYHDRLSPRTGGWFEHAQPAGAHHSPGVREVWIGSPRRLSSAAT